MKAWLTSYVSAGVVFLAIDAVWLTTMTGLLYRPMLGDLIAAKPRLGPAVAFYLIYIAGVVTFAVMPALASGRWTTALFFGAALGLVAYATYDLTNQATIQSWPLVVTLADLAWGSVLTATAATAAYFVTNAVIGLGQS
jgi:uncharacterized membrane protein